MSASITSPIRLIPRSWTLWVFRLDASTERTQALRAVRDRGLAVQYFDTSDGPHVAVNTDDVDDERALQRALAEHAPDASLVRTVRPVAVAA